MTRIFVIILAVLLHTGLYAQDLVNTETGSELYVTKVEKGANNITEVWTKTKAIPGNERLYKDDIISARKEYNEKGENTLTLKGFEHLDHTVCKAQYDCVNKKYRYSVYTYYDKNDKVIDATNYDAKTTAWEDAPTGSVHEAMLSVLCK